ncbi:hypothetical protein KAT51_05970, partial [bacterium]|nr:hypothetical protein [bacterium]
CLAHESFFDVRNVGQLWWEKLERDFSFQLCVLGFVDDAHAAFAEFIEDIVMRYCFTNHI